MKLSGVCELVCMLNALDNGYNYFSWSHNEDDDGIKVIINDHVYEFSVKMMGLHDCLELIGILDEIKDGAKLTDWSFSDDNGIVMDIDGVSHLFEMS